MTASTQWQLAHAAAERYQSILTPSILGPFAQALVDFAAPAPGERVVDIGCGTGAATRHAAAGSAGAVTGIDINTGMLEVARDIPHAGDVEIAWHEADCCRLPLDDDAADAVLCAQTLQFVGDKPQALQEMRRIVAPTGRVVLSLWCPMEDNPYFAALTDAVAQNIDPATAAGLGAAFSLSDPGQIATLLEQGGIDDAEVSITTLDLTLPDLREFVPRHISATPMAAGYAGAPTEAQTRVVVDVADALVPFADATGVTVPFRSFMIMARAVNTG